MQRYFLTEKEFNNNIIINDFHHITRVMRMKVNDKFIVVYNSISYEVEIFEITESLVKFKICKKTFSNELNIKVSIIQGYPKGEKTDYIIKKSTELGVYKLFLIPFERSIVKIDDKKVKSKTERFNKISRSAAEQSQRNIIPKVEILKSVKDIDYNKYDYKILAYEEESKNNELKKYKNILKEISKKHVDNISICVVIGPEGGVSSNEYKYFKEKNFISTGLGKRIMRTETVSSFILSTIIYESEL